MRNLYGSPNNRTGAGREKTAKLKFGHHGGNHPVKKFGNRQGVYNLSES